MKREDYDEIIAMLREARSNLPVQEDGAIVEAGATISRVVGKLEAHRDLDALREEAAHANTR
jgi:hypothetical protein